MNFGEPLGLFRVDAVRCRYACSCCNFSSLSKQTLFECCEQQEDIIRPTAVAHQSDTPDLALEIAQAAAYLDAELGKQPFPDGQIVDAGRNVDGVELRQLVSFGCRVGNAQSGQACFQS